MRYKVSTRHMKPYTIAVVLLLLFSCKTTLTLHTNEYKNIEFVRTKTIYIETDSEIVELSSRLKQKLINAKFNITNRRQDAEYILNFNYTAKFDVYPWVFRSFNLKMSELASGDVLYKVESDRSGSEPVESVMERAVQDMAKRLLINQKQHRVGLTPGTPENEIIDTEDIDDTLSNDFQEQKISESRKSPVLQKPKVALILATPESEIIDTEDIDDTRSVDFQKQKSSESSQSQRLQETDEKDSTDDKEYFIQVGSWKNPGFAQTLLTKLKKYYPNSYIFIQDDFYKVRIPKIRSKEQGKKIIKDIEDTFKIKSFLVQTESNKK